MLEKDVGIRSGNKNAPLPLPLPVLCLGGRENRDTYVWDNLLPYDPLHYTERYKSTNFPTVSIDTKKIKMELSLLKKKKNAIFNL